MKRLSCAAAIACALTSTAVLADPPKEDGMWRGSLSASLAVASGNTKSTNFNLGANGVKATKEDRITLFLTSLYGTRDVAGKSEKTANLTRGGGRYDWNLSDRTFVFGTLEAEQDKIQRLDSRVVAGGGFGYKLIKEKDLSWDLFGGVVHSTAKNTVTVTSLTPLPVRTFDTKVTNNSTELLLGEESNHKLSESTSFKQKLTVFPNLSKSGERRIQFDAGIVTAIANGISLQVTLSNRYDSMAPAGTKKSDTLLLTGINIALGAK
jgi:putative salt-induced outer membrane protein